ncbi:HAMP domain-containing histidine kinase [Echinicola soli]|uniref:histidine kinase n=1 Tax=Echinicola soli TaxID=2591634 RepID=A0A514CK75_9BACT|nr:HAMP domain-containing sensor histidine kinase [Echinicola soli]QDH80212.1 HAMP domain-containing histidine kinase [Echinicola soli]
MDHSQPKKPFKLFNRLFWEVSAIFLTVLLVFSAITLVISIKSARDYAEEVNQKLNYNLANNVLGVIEPLVVKDSINQGAIEDLLHSMMVINPTLEIYILAPDGKIRSFVAPDKVVQLDHVNLEPVKTFLNNTDKSIIYGDDPRNPGEKKIFSASKIKHDKELAGYLYIVLSSQEYISTAHMVEGSYILGLSIRSVMIILVITAIMGLVALWFLTKKLNTIISGISAFKSGRYETRIPLQNQNELDKISVTFNQMAETIERNIEELKSLDSLRRELISNISHDLRTPIASIQGYAETLLLKINSLSQSDQLHYLDIIVKSSEKLKGQVASLFELSKLEAKQIKPSIERFGISELVQDITNKYRVLAKQKHISFNTVFPKELLLVDADISLIERALQNLIDNAIKFTPEGGTITLEVDLKSDQKVKVSITDDGTGIQKEDLPFIFERYYKKSNQTSSEDNTGLGLAIVKKIIELHQSEINVVSHPGKGTSFSFMLPVEQAS